MESTETDQPQELKIDANEVVAAIAMIVIGTAEVEARSVILILPQIQAVIVISNDMTTPVTVNESMIVMIVRSVGRGTEVKRATSSSIYFYSHFSIDLCSDISYP
jgi:hypothetical protein